MFRFESRAETSATPEAVRAAVACTGCELEADGPDGFRLFLVSTMGEPIRGDVRMTTDAHDQRTLEMLLLTEEPLIDDGFTPPGFLEGLARSFEEWGTQFAAVVRESAETFAATGVVPVIAAAEGIVPGMPAVVEARLRGMLRTNPGDDGLVVTVPSPEGWVRHEFEVRAAGPGHSSVAVVSALDLPLDSPSASRPREVHDRFQAAAWRNLARLTGRLAAAQRAITSGGIQSQL